MAGRTTELRTQIKERFVPFLIQKGFSADKSHATGTMIFRRVEKGRLHICDVQWDKYGKPRFILNFGVAELGNRRMEELGTWDCETYLQMKPRRGASSRHWFRQDKPWLSSILSKEKNFSAASVVTSLISLFAETEDFWQTGRIGPHLTVVRKI